MTVLAIKTRSKNESLINAITGNDHLTELRLIDNIRNLNLEHDVTYFLYASVFLLFKANAYRLLLEKIEY